MSELIEISISLKFNARGIGWALMVFASICEHASGAFIFSSKSSDQICFACTEHFRKYLMTSSEHFVNLTHLTREILTDATENNCIAKSYFQFLSFTQIVPVSKVILN